MNLSMRSPEMVRKKVSSDQIEILCATNQGEGTRRITRSGAAAVIQSMEGDPFSYALILEGAALRLYDGIHHDGYEYTLVPDDPDRDGIKRIASKGPSGVILLHLINEASGYEVERLLEVDLRGQVFTIRQHFSDHRAVEQAVLPHRYTIEINGKSRAETTIESIQLNPGLAPWMFALDATADEASGN